MLPWFILGIGLLVGVLLGLKWFSEAAPKDIAKVLKWLGIICISGFFLFLLMTGRLNWVVAAVGAAVPLMMRAWRVWQIANNVRTAASWAKGMGPGSSGWSSPGQSGQTSSIKTRFLEMILDHDTGAISGRVIAGPEMGQDLDDLGLEPLLALHAHYDRTDDETRQVFEAYLDRQHPDWREAGGFTGAGSEGGGEGPGRNSGAANGPMTREEALEVLGLDETATPSDIKQAYHRLMSGVHPDHGGSDYLAAKLNQAKDCLLT